GAVSKVQCRKLAFRPSSNESLRGLTEGQSQEGQAEIEGPTEWWNPGAARGFSYRLKRIYQGGPLWNACLRPVDGRRTVGADPFPLIDCRRLIRVPALSDLSHRKARCCQAAYAEWLCAAKT